ncbi:hypothetical protein ACJIZ3_017157 [Penstemon smallii]|uniref:Uncharacterized protein n=1 Tax=Penstemon smallii TaxID=265156 RepID=A0ABD3SVI8_9LAMI
MLKRKLLVDPEANFSPSLWGDQFMNYTFDTQEAEKYTKEIDVLKYEVMKSMLETEMVQVEAMNLIDTLERLGISYHFENEIEEKLQQFFNLNTNYESYDLYTVALHFRLFRQHGHHISSEIFNKFLDGNGKFQEELKSDVKGLLSLYEASYLRIRGENILEEALVFTTTNLKSMAPNLGSLLRNQVLHALNQPLHLGNPRIESRNFISTYEENESKHESLLKFAKLDYNLLQMLHKTSFLRWWKELDLVNQLPYIRDRLVECYLWAMGTIFHEPKYSRARIMVAKTIIMTFAIDDTWDINEIKHLPEYMKPIYKALLELYQEFHEELSKEERSYATFYAIESMKELARSYYVEAKWFIEGYMPPFAEYLDNALITCTYCYLAATSLMVTKSSTKEQFECLIISRVIDDIATYEVEKERGQAVSGIECYMKENGVTKEEDTNEEFMKNLYYNSSDSRYVLKIILNQGRMIEVTYKNFVDGYSEPEKVLKPHILALFVDPIN